MGENPPDAKFNNDAPSITTMNPTKLKKLAIDGPMNKEEIKMNKNLINEIYQLKKELGDHYDSAANSGKKAYNSQSVLWHW